jgi:hypothetical protein
MVVSRSIDLLEESAAESGNTIRPSRRGYLFATANEPKPRARGDEPRVGARHGSGAHASRTARVFPGTERGPSRPTDRRGPPPETKCIAHFHISRATPLPHFTCGAPVGSTRSRSDRGSSAAVAGATFEGTRDRVRSDGGRVRDVSLSTGDVIATDRFVIAAGAGLPGVAGAARRHASGVQ